MSFAADRLKAARKINQARVEYDKARAEYDKLLHERYGLTVKPAGQTTRERDTAARQFYAKVLDATKAEQSKALIEDWSARPTTEYTYTVLYRSTATRPFQAMPFRIKGEFAADALERDPKRSTGDYILIRVDGAVTKFTVHTPVPKHTITAVAGF